MFMNYGKICWKSSKANRLNSIFYRFSLRKSELYWFWPGVWESENLRVAEYGTFFAFSCGLHRLWRTHKNEMEVYFKNMNFIGTIVAIICGPSCRSSPSIPPTHPPPYPKKIFLLTMTLLCIKWREREMNVQTSREGSNHRWRAGVVEGE